MGLVISIVDRHGRSNKAHYEYLPKGKGIIVLALAFEEAYYGKLP